MDTTTTDVVYKNFVDCVDNNIFLQSVFPSGLGDVLVGQFGLDEGQFSLNIHVFKQPDREIKKWGIWGVNYNVVVIKLLGAGVDDIAIRNWQSYTSGPLLCWIIEDRLFINCQPEGRFFEISCSGLIFQSCSTYIK
jgi:hypothetical protein